MMHDQQTALATKVTGPTAHRGHPAEKSKFI